MFKTQNIWETLSEKPQPWERTPFEASLTKHASILHHPHFRRDIFSCLHIFLNWDPTQWFCFLYLNSSLVRCFWIHKELVSIMNGLLNYWHLFTSLLFTVIPPPCFLWSITCPELTYLPVHLFRASSFSAPLSFSTELSAWLQSVGWSKRGERRGEGRKFRKLQTACSFDCTCIWMYRRSHSFHEGYVLCLPRNDEKKMHILVVATVGQKDLQCIWVVL